MVTSVNGYLSSSSIYRLINPTTPTVPSDDGDFLSGIASKLVSRLTAVNDARSKLEQFQKSARALTGPQATEPFEQRQATTTAPTTVTATAKPGASQRTYAVKVDQIAKADQLQSDRLTDTAQAVAGGANTFSLTVAGKTTQVSVTLDPSDTNDKILAKTAKAITDAGAGVKAEVVKGDTAGTSRLQLTSGATGTNAAISVADVSGTLTSQVGLTTAATATATTGGRSVVAQNASYAIDGGATVTSQSNEISLDEGKVTLSLKGANATAASVAVTTDEAKVAKAIEGFVANYNDVLSYSRSVGSVLPSRVSQSLSGLVTANKGSFERAGISRKADGTLHVDQDKLRTALKADSTQVAKAFNDGFTGIARETQQTIGSLRQTLNADSTAASRQLGQTYTRQQLSTSFNLLGQQFRPLSQLIQFGGTVNTQA